MSLQSDAGRIGVWLVGAFGGVGTTIAMGVASLKRGLAKPWGMATELEKFRSLPFIGMDQVVLGGHDVRKGEFVASAAELHRTSAVFSPGLISAAADDLGDWTANVRPGLVRRSGAPVEAFADWQSGATGCSPIEQIASLADDIRDFQAKSGLRHVIVVNVASSEPTMKLGPEHASWERLSPLLRQAGDGPVPATSLYALAAVEAGASFINFTPSLGLSSPALEERAKEKNAVYCGKDGKTGETLMKAVLAPMFARRNLDVMSWVGHNILGNRDGLVLKDSESKKGKVEAKDRLLSQILGYEPQTLVSIEYIESLGDRKTAWDHIHFQGFLGAQMTLQFTWQGCDSLLAAPLILDLVRWTELAQRRGERGCLTHLASYFKSPMHVDEQDFFRQWAMLEDYAAKPAS